ncbi:MAG: hypothetical protein K2W96_28095 [Gemmataceae bacterium]|nr:hypothetical protein [Gemmataceae bacterium]
MPLADDIRAAGARAIAALAHAHDYHTFSTRVWGAFKDSVREGGAYSFRNPATGTRFTGEALVPWAERHVEPALGRAALYEFVSALEDFVFDLLRLWLAAHPRSLSRKQVELGAILDLPDKPAIVLSVVDKELNELKYQRLADWFAYLDKLVRPGCPSTDEIASLAEIKATRDVLAHNQGVANAVYVQKAGPLARFAVGEPVEANPPYIRAAHALLKVVSELAESAASRA